MSYRGGRNIAVKVPPHRWEATVAFYERTLGLAVRRRESASVAFGFWIVNPADVVHLVTRREE